MGRTVHFEIQASEPQALIDFYGKMFDWSFSKWEGGEYWLVGTGEVGAPGINGGLLPRRGPRPEEGASVNAFVCTVDVEDLDKSISLLKELKGTVAVPRMPVSGVGWLAYAKDPDGNLFGMMQNDASASFEGGE
ncbi:VOC family protein [Duganella sp. Root336D2]|uniref:VOC family protein n=1 Tax=Duganella sp. Root336D2 TaxID=1736518 RepID=UPI0006FCEDF0|nr:VOC family protein [Duganella sp. Root336D2]KQV51207.1 glyoxalase [Duganella sp. Root336D2]